jgi:hypothetical protein
MFYTGLIRIHSRIVLIAVGLFPFMALTGGVWTILKRHLHASKDDVKWLIRWHQGDILNLDPSGKYIKTLFCVLAGLISIVTIVSGLLQLNLRSALHNRNKYRRFHQMFALISCLPLLVTATSGSIWAICRYWLEMDKVEIRWLIKLHQGWFDCFIAYYPVVLAISTIVLSTAGSLIIDFNVLLKKNLDKVKI